MAFFYWFFQITFQYLIQTLKSVTKHIYLKDNDMAHTPENKNNSLQKNYSLERQKMIQLFICQKAVSYQESRAPYHVKTTVGFTA